MKFRKKLISLILTVIMLFSTISVIFASAESDTEKSGTFKCAWFNETLTYPYEYSDGYFSGLPTEYYHDLAEFALCVAMASFNSFDKEKGDEHIKAMLEECGFEVNSYGYDTEDYDTMGVAFGRKVIDGCNVIVAAVRSGNYGMEWGGNLRVGSGMGDHEGFRIAADILIRYINQYFTDYPCEGKTKLLIPGYSRGGSVTNLTAAALDDGSYIDVLNGEKDSVADVDFDLYAYTFEAPQCTTSKEVFEDIYKNIFNIVNPNDYVPMFVMDEWGFSNYGIRVELPCADNCDNYDSYYEKLCDDFDSYMGVNNRKAKNIFYDKEESRSVQTTLNYIFSTLASDVMKDREFYHENYEDSLVFFAGQYLGRKRKINDFARTMGWISVGTAIAASPKNFEKIKNSGYKKYISEYLSNHNGGELTDEQIEGTLNFLTALFEYLNAKRIDVVSLVEQLNTVLQVHQPFVALTWMRILDADDIHLINGNFDSVFTLSCKTLNLKYNVNGRITARYDSNLGHVEWKTDDENVASVNQNGVVHGNANGTTTVTAVLVSDSGLKIAEQSVDVTIKMDAIQSAIAYVRNILKV